MIIKLSDELVEGLANKYILVKPRMTFEQYVQVYVRESKIGKSEHFKVNTWQEEDWKQL